MTKHVSSLTWYDVEEQTKSNTLISGTNHTGKTRLACQLARILRAYGWSVIAFDNSGIWKTISEIPYFFQVYRMPQLDVPISRNIIYDISLLTCSKQRKFVNEILQYFWTATVNNPIKSWQIFILEEAELYCKNLRGEVSENIYRIMHVGRNQRMGVIAITTDLALIDPSYIRLCLQRFHFKLSVEENSLRKFRRYYGNDWCRVCTTLDTGFCMYWNNGKAKIVKIPLFKPTRLPREVTKKKESRSIVDRILGRHKSRSYEERATQQDWEQWDDELTEESLMMFDDVM